MNTLQLTAILFGMGVIMAVLAVGVTYGLAAVLGIADDVIDVRITFMFLVVSAIVIYGMSFGAFAGVQKDSCGEVRSWKQVALNALIPLGFQVVIMTLILAVPWFRNVIGNLFPPGTPEFAKTATAFAYYSFWATMMGGALGGTFSGSCKADTKPLTDLVQLPPLQTNLPSLPQPEAGFRGDLPPE
jgi:hypothetical protein